MFVTQGTVQIHSSPAYLIPEIEKGLSRALGSSVTCAWSPQSMRPGCSRTLLDWVGPIGSGSVIVSTLQNFESLLFEVTEDQSKKTDGARWMHTPSCGVFYAPTDSAGNLVISENRITWITNSSKDHAELCREIKSALGQPWDEELEPYRSTAPSWPARLFRVS